MTEATGSKFVYVTFIRTTPERLWDALTTPDFITQYWFGMKCDSDFKTGSSWRLIFTDGRVAGFHPEGRYEFKVHLDNAATRQLKPTPATAK